MKVEETLREKKFNNEWHHLRVNLLFSAGWLSGEIRNFLSPFGLTQKQFNILRILRGVHPDPVGLTINDLRDRMIDRMSDTSRLIDRLEKKRLVRKELCREDRRYARVFITAGGLALLSDIDRSIPELDALMQRLSHAEAAWLNELLDKLRGGK